MEPRVGSLEFEKLGVCLLDSVDGMFYRVLARERKDHRPREVGQVFVREEKIESNLIGVELRALATAAHRPCETAQNQGKMNF